MPLPGTIAPTRPAAVASATLGSASANASAPTKRRSRSPPLRAVAAFLAVSTRAGNGLVDRNIFCSACPARGPEDGPRPPITDAESPPATALPLRLVATTVASGRGLSFATIRNTATARQGAYAIGAEIPEAGPIRRIRPAHVDFENEATHRIERISFPPPARVQPNAPLRGVTAGDIASVRRPSANDELQRAIDAGVRQIDEHTFEVDRALVNRTLANPTMMGRGARVAPSAKDGQPNGLKLYRVRPSSAYARLGFMRGDTIHAVNGFELTSIDKALEVYTKVRDSSALSVSITRGGKPIVLNYSIR